MTLRQRRPWISLLDSSKSGPCRTENRIRPASPVGSVRFVLPRGPGVVLATVDAFRRLYSNSSQCQTPPGGLGNVHDERFSQVRQSPLHDDSSGFEVHIRASGFQAGAAIVINGLAGWSTSPSNSAQNST